MNTKDFAKRILVAILSLVITITYMPAAVFAEPISDQKTTQSEAASDIAAPSEETAPEKSDAEETTAAENSDAEETVSPDEGKSADEPAEAGETDSFTREAEIDDVIVKVEAEAGVFPDDAELVVEKVSKKDEAKAAEAIDEVRPAELNVADSYTFDIKLVDAEGTELQPADDQKVNVTFNMARAADPNLSADIYHITENEVIDEKTKETEIVLEAEKLDAEQDVKEATVAAETDGFSLYTVRFTYSDLSYTVEYDSDDEVGVPLQTIIDELGIEGRAVQGSVKDEYQPLFDVNGGYVKFSQPFDSPLLKALIARVVVHSVEFDADIVTDYEITIDYCRDVVIVDKWSGLQRAVNDSANNGKTIRVTDNLWAGDNDRILVKNKKLTIDLNGFTLDRQRDDNDSDGHVIELQDGSDITIKNGGIEGGYATHGGGIYIGKGCICNLENVNIWNNKAKEDGGAIYVRGSLNMSGGKIYSNESKDTAGAIYCQDTGTFNIDGVAITSNHAENDGGAFVVHLDKDALISNCEIIGNYSNTEDGGAIRMDSDKTLTISDTNITNNKAEDNGGGIVIDEGTVAMVRCTIAGNESNDGGGVYNDDGNIDFKDVTIERNKSKKYGGAGINNKRHAVLENCTIKNNEGHASGGGIYSNDDITLDNCTIEGNSATGDGGGIHSEDSKVNLNNCIIKNNSAAKSGGGIRIHDGTTNLNNTSFEGNIAYELGGGIYTNNDATLNMSGSTLINGNSAAVGGGGILIGDSEDNKVTIKDKFVVSENEASKGANVYFISKTKTTGAGSWASTEIIVTPLRLIGPLAEGSVVGVAIDQDIVDNSEAITLGYRSYHGDKDPHEIFESESGYSLQTNSAGEVVLHVSEWPDLQKLVNDAANGDGELKLDKNWKGRDVDVPLTIPEGKTLELDLNGYSINRNFEAEAADNGRVFNVEGGRTLKIIDSSGKKKGKITGGSSNNGGAVYVQSGGSFEFVSGNITGNKAENGGAIYNEGTVTINGKGLISGNNGTNGGGIYNAGTLNIKADSVKGNLAGTGGGIYSAAGTVNLESAVSGNEASEKAGGIYYAEDSILNVSSNASVKDNNGASGTNIYMAGDSTLINVTSSLSDAAYIDVVAQNPNAKNDRKLTNDWDVNKGSGTLAYNGIASDSSDKVKVEEGELWLNAITGEGIKWISSWRELSRALRSDEVRNIALAKDLKPGDSDKNYPLEVINAKKTLDLCGHTLDSNGTEFVQGTGIGTSDIMGMVISVGLTWLGGDTDSGELELKDSIGTGAVTGGNCGSITYPVGGGGILITKNSKCAISGVAITGNKSDKDGGGIYNKGSLTMTGGAVTGNKAGFDYCEKDEGRGGGIFNAGTIILNGVRISENTSYNGGGGIFIKSELSSDITDCLIDNNQTLSGHGGGVYADMSGKTLKIEGGEINDNLAYEEDTLEKIPHTEDYIYFENNGGGIYLKAGTLNMTNGSISGNTSESGGGIYNEDGSINLNGTEINGNTAKSQIAIDDETHTPTIFGGTGGGIYTKGSAELGNSKVSGNSAGNTGGGIYTKKSLTVTDGAVTANQSETEGGGIHFAGGSLKLTGSGEGGLTIEGNEAMDEASGIRADRDLSIEGEIHMDDNSLWLASGKKITIYGALGDGSMINVALADTWGVFTDGFKDKHPGADPANYFRSDYGYGVHRTSDGEAELRLDLDDGSHFIDMDNQINDESRLTKANWMSGISGDRYLNEINIPCTHDSAMNVVNYNTFSSVG